MEKSVSPSGELAERRNKFSDGSKDTGGIDDPAIEHVKIRLLPDGRMNRRDAARYLGIAVKTVAMWDLENPEKLGGIKVGGRRFYFKDRLDAVIRGE